MLAFPILLLAPIVLILGLYFLIRGPRIGLLPGLLGALAVTALQFWAIRQSRSSTAAIGILFIPGFASLAMASIWGARRLLVSLKTKNETRRWRLTATYLLYLPAIAIAVATVKSGFGERERNERRDEEQRVRTEKYNNAKIEIRAALAKSPGHETQLLDQMIEAHREDEMFLGAALDFKEVTTERLKTLANNERFEIAIVRHPNVTPEIIEEIYRRSKYKESFFTTLASIPKTPKPILMEIAKGKVGYALLQLIENPSIDCDIASNVEDSAAKADGDYRKQIEEKAAKAIFRLCGP